MTPSNPLPNSQACETGLTGKVGGGGGKGWGGGKCAHGGPHVYR